MAVWHQGLSDIHCSHACPVSGFQALFGVLKDNHTLGSDPHPVRRFEIDIRSWFRPPHISRSDDGVEQRTQSRRDERGFDISANAIRTNSHGDASEPVTSNVGDNLDLPDEMKVGKKDLVHAFIEILPNQRLYLKVCFVRIEKIVWTEPMTGAVPLRRHNQAKSRKSLLDGVQMSSRTVHEGSIAIEDESVERSSFQFKVH